MQLYFSPLACSMATRIAFYEAGADVTYTQVSGHERRTLPDGSDFRAINPLGYVPTLRTDDGALVTENAAILQWVANRFPAAQLAPTDGFERTRLHEWLHFIGTELHKGIFALLLDKHAPAEVKKYALDKSTARFDVLERHLAGREHLLDRFSVADAYLVTVLNWVQVTPIELTRWPNLSAYAARLRKRPSVARAMAEEGRLYAELHARRA